MNQIKLAWEKMCSKNRLGLRVVLVIIAVFFMGFTLSFLDPIQFGTDPCTVMNLAIAHRLGWLYGTTLLLFNCALFLVVIFTDLSKIGIGTVANMVLVGYSKDLIDWLIIRHIPKEVFEPMLNRILIMIPALGIFVFVVAVYICVDLGTSPYDAIPSILTERFLKIPGFVIRMIWDLSMTVIGFLLGGTVGVVTVIMAFFLGPVISLVRKLLERVFKFT